MTTPTRDTADRRSRQNRRPVRRRPKARATARSSSASSSSRSGSGISPIARSGSSCHESEADQLWPLAVIAARRLADRPTPPLSVMVRRLGAGRRLGHRSRLARRLATPSRGAVRGGARPCGDRPGGRASTLAGGPRTPLPRAPAVAGSGRRHAPRSRPTTSSTIRRSASTLPVEPAPPPQPGRLRSRAAQQRCRHPLVQPRRASRDPVRWRGTRALRLLDGGLCGWPVHPLPRRHEWARDVRCRTLPRRRAKSADLGGDPVDGHAHPRLQLRVPAVVCVRSALGLPAGTAGEPARPCDPGGRAVARGARRLNSSTRSATAAPEGALAYHRGVTDSPTTTRTSRFIAIPDDIREFIDDTKFATIATNDPDGRHDRRSSGTP